MYLVTSKKWKIFSTFCCFLRISELYISQSSLRSKFLYFFSCTGDLLLLWSSFKSKCHFWRKNQQISKWIYVTSFTKLPIQKILAGMHISINLKNKSISSIYLKARTCIWLPLASSHTLGKNLIMLVFTIELVNESIWATDISAELPGSFVR